MYDQKIVIALTINESDANYAQYKALTAKAKIHRLSYRIEQICRYLQTHAPDAEWIFVWREHGIQDPDHKTIDHQIKKNDFKKKFSALRWKYANLTIIAGTIATRKQTSVRKLSSLMRYYQDQKWHASFEFKNHKKEIAKAIRYQVIDDYSMTLRNTCYIFENCPLYLISKREFVPNSKKHTHVYYFIREPLQLIYINFLGNIEELMIFNKKACRALLKKIPKTDKIQNIQVLLVNKPLLLHEFVRIVTDNKEHRSRILRIDKTTPFKETETYQGIPSLFKIGGKNWNKWHLFRKFIVEICFEHNLGVAQYEKTQLLHNQVYPIHFVLSDWLALQLQHTQAEYTIHVDSYIEPEIIIRNTNLKSKVALFKNNLLQFNTKLVQVRPIYPFYFELLNEIESKKNALPESTTKMALTENLAILNKVHASVYLSDQNDLTYVNLKETLTTFKKGYLVDDPYQISDFYSALLQTLDKRCQAEKALFAEYKTEQIAKVVADDGRFFYLTHPPMTFFSHLKPIVSKPSTMENQSLSHCPSFLS